ncbi:MAG: hypothetical protein ABEJ59_06750 [Halanaeroarchaeum sp.]
MSADGYCVACEDTVSLRSSPRVRFVVGGLVAVAGLLGILGGLALGGATWFGAFPAGSVGVAGVVVGYRVGRAVDEQRCARCGSGMVSRVRVDDGDGTAGPGPGVPGERNRVYVRRSRAAILAMVGGVLGLHKFYQGNYRLGTL